MYILNWVVICAYKKLLFCREILLGILAYSNFGEAIWNTRKWVNTWDGNSCFEIRNRRIKKSLVLILPKLNM